MSKTAVATGNNTGLPDQTAMETFAFADSGLGGYTAIVDPANPTHALAPDVNGAIPVTMATPPTGAATSAKQDTGNTSVASIDGKTPALGQALAAASVPVVLTAAQLATITPPAAISGFATSANQASELTLVGAVTETAPASDTASSGLNGRLQRIAQRLTSMIAQLPAALGAGGGLKVDGSGTALPVSAASLPLPSGAATDTALTTQTGALTETAPASDTASSGLNGRLQRVAQRLTSLIALLPTSLGTGGGLKVDGSGTALPVSAAALPLPSGASTAAKQPALGTAGTPSADVLSVQGAASMTPLIVGGTTSCVVSSTLTRPADVNAYLAGDVVNASTVTGTLQQFAGATRLPSTAGYLTSLQLTTNQKACAAQMRIHFWSGSVSGSSVPADNAVFPILIGDAALYLGYVDLPPFGTEDTTSTMAIAFDDTIRKRIVSDASSILYWQMQTKTAFTPNNAQTFLLTATFEKN